MSRCTWTAHERRRRKGSKSSSPIRQAFLEGDWYDWVTSASAFAASVTSMQNVASFDLDRKFILDSGATTSMGGVDLLQRIQEIYADVGFNPTSHPVKPLRFSFAKKKEEKKTCSGLASNFQHSRAQRAKTRFVGS